MAGFKELDEDHNSLKLPDLESADYVVGLLLEAGPMSPTGMGPVPLSWVDIDTWLRVTGRDIGLWERLTIKRLSEEYVDESMLARDVDRPAPFVHVVEPEELDRAKIGSKIYSILMGFKKKPPETTGEVEE